MTYHLRDRVGKKPQKTVCGWNGSRITGGISVEDLLVANDACPRCLEWVVEQGQLAAARLETMNQPKEPQA